MVRDVSDHQVVLPTALVEPADVSRLLRELEEVDEFLRQAAVRNPGSTAGLPKTTKTLHELAEANGLNLLQPTDRARVTNILEWLYKSAPVVHLSFASDPSAAFIAKIITYLRQNIHPYLLVQVGLQPTLAAGCMVRTTSKVFDLSLRASLTAHRNLLMQALAGMDKPTQAQAAVPAAAQPAQAQGVSGE